MRLQSQLTGEHRTLQLLDSLRVEPGMGLHVSVHCSLKQTLAHTLPIAPYVELAKQLRPSIRLSILRPVDRGWEVYLPVPWGLFPHPSTNCTLWLKQIITVHLEGDGSNFSGCFDEIHDSLQTSPPLIDCQLVCKLKCFLCSEYFVKKKKMDIMIWLFVVVKHLFFFTWSVLAKHLFVVNLLYGWIRLHCTSVLCQSNLH